MAKSRITLPNGTEVTIDGTPAEIAQVLALYSPGGGKPLIAPVRKPTKTRDKKTRNPVAEESSGDRIIEIVNAAKDSDEAENIERNILDRSSQVDRALLPIYLSHKHLGHKDGLTTGEISKVLANLGVKVAASNISHTVVGAARNYVMGDKTRKSGQAVRYGLSRKGLLYIEGVIRAEK